jgi:hypothetical protein
VISSNFYLRGLTENDYTGIRQLAPAEVEMKPHISRHGAEWDLGADLRNVSKVPALMLRIKVVREKSGDLIAPALFDDNYIALMPGERRTLHVQLQEQDTRGERPKLIVEGYNLANPGNVITATVP